MLTWGEFEKAAPEMAKFGQDRMKFGVFYLATIGPDAYPRVHPFTPFIGSGHLFAFMYPTSPKGKDLRRNHKFAMHSLVADMNGTNGEFLIKGDAYVVDGPDERKEAIAACPYARADYPDESALLFEFKIGRCMTNNYQDGNPITKHWKLSANAFL